MRRSPRTYVLDANALIGYVEDRPVIAERVQRLLDQALREDSALLMSVINWGEVFYIAWKRHGEAKARDTAARVQHMPILMIAVDTDRVVRAAALKAKHALGYADSFAAELAMERGAWLVTADREFEKVGKGLLTLLLPRHER